MDTELPATVVSSVQLPTDTVCWAVQWKCSGQIGWPLNYPCTNMKRLRNVIFSKENGNFFYKNSPFFLNEQVFFLKEKKKIK